MKKLLNYLLLIILLALVTALGSFAQTKKEQSKQPPKDTFISLQMGELTRLRFEANEKRKAKADSISREILLLFIEGKGIKITPDLEIKGYEKGTLVIKKNN